MQMEVLRRLRSGGQQTVRVEHVHVNDGGQAVIGNVKEDAKVLEEERIGAELPTVERPFRTSTRGFHQKCHGCLYAKATSGANSVMCAELQQRTRSTTEEICCLQAIQNAIQRPF